MVVALIGGLCVALFVAVCIAAYKRNVDPDAVEQNVLRQLEREAGEELSQQEKSELFVELRKVTDVATYAAQMRALSPIEFDRLYRKGAIQVYATALGLARHFKAGARA